MGRPKGSKNKLKNLENFQRAKYEENLQQMRYEKYLDSKRVRYQKYLDKFDDWKSTVIIVGAITIVVFCIAMGLVIKYGIR